MVAHRAASASIDLDADSSSAGAARAFLRRTLAEWGCADDLVDDSLLVCTELVTNAVLYAAPPVSVAVRMEGPVVRIAVRDGSALMPAPRNYGPDASTGRGLALLGAVGRWGASPRPNRQGKEVWVELGGAIGRGEVAVERGPSEVHGLPMVHFLRVPVPTYLALEAHNDGLLREFDLLAGYADQGGVLPTRLHEIVVEVRGQFSVPRAAYRREVEAAAVRGDPLVDLAAPFTPASTEPSRRYVDLLEEAEGFAGTGDVLAEPASPPVARLRRWFVDEMVRQLGDGLPPAPAPRETWPG